MAGPSASDLTTISNVKQRLALAASDDDFLLQGLVTSISVFAQSWTGRTFALVTYTESYDGRNSDTIMVRNSPIASITSITADGVAVPARSAFGSSGYLNDDSFIYYDGGKFRKGRQNVAVVYQGGYETTPPDMEESVIELVCVAYKEKDRIGQTSKGIGPEHVSFIMKDLPDRVKAIWQQYKRVVPVG